MQQHKVGMRALFNAIALQAQQACRVQRDGIEALLHACAAGHLRHMQAHARHLQCIARSQAVPGVHHAVMAKRHRHASGHQLGHARHAPALGVGVVAALDRDVDQGVADNAQLRLGHQGHQLADVVVVHVLHGGKVGAGHAAMQPQALRVVGQRLHMARHRVIRLVTVHVHPLAALGGQFAENAHALCAIGHRALKVRNAPDDIDAQVQRALEVVQPARCAQHAILRKSHQLQIDIRRHALLHIEHRFDRQQAGVTGVHMAADGQQATRHRPVTVGQGALDQGLMRQLGFEFAPERNAFEQGAAFVDTRHAVAQGGIHVEVRVHKGRAQQQALGVHHLGRWRLQALAHLGNLAVLHSHRHVLAAIGQAGIANQ